MSTPSHRASNSAGGKSSKAKESALDLTTARRMLPLVRGIVADIVDTHARLGRLTPERDLLDETRLGLNWASRQRRYAVGDEISRAEKQMSAAVAELAGLGVRLIDPDAGQVEFPTKINGRSAAFAWQPGDDTVTFWRYAGEAPQRRPIPADWTSGSPLRVRAE